MSEHQQPSMERHCDVAIIGGSAAGLAAGLQLGRQRRSVIVVDAGEPRNAPAAHMHSYLGHEGLPPSELLAIAREEVRSYGGELLAGRVERVTGSEAEGFRLELAGGHAVVARRVVVASGIVDELPAIEGVTEHWGGDVIHCPFCHGYEVRDRRIVQIVTHPMGLHATPLLRQLTDRLTVVVHGSAVVDDDRLGALWAAGVRVVHATVQRLTTGPDGHVATVELLGHEAVDADAVVVGPRFRPRIEPLAGLGLLAVPHPSGLGEVVEVDAAGATAIAGVYAAGNVTDPGQQVLQAAAHGARVGGVVSFSLADEDLAAEGRPSANQADWDHRYGGDRLWSGNPNGTLVAEVADLAPGRALDVGAGEGGDAVWLAEQGWRVTASDVSEAALRRVEAEAERRGLAVELLHADANALDPFEAGAHDLVSAQYASIPRTPDGRGVANLMAAVAPGGTLVVVGHDLAAMRAALEGRHTQLFDPDAYVRVADVAAAVAAAPGWEVEHHEVRPRPPGAASGHHVEDEVLRARRRSAT